MLGNSKLLTMAAIGVIGVGAAMPYWSHSELSSPQSATAGRDGSSSRVDAFIGQEQNDSPPAFEIPTIQRVVSLQPTSGGLDTAAVAAPRLTEEYPARISANATPQQLVDLSPQGYQRVSIARREVPANSVESIAIPVEMPPSDLYRAPEPRRRDIPAETPVGQQEPSRKPESRWQPTATTIVVNKPVLPQVELRSTAPPASEVQPPAPQPAFAAPRVQQSNVPAQPRRSHRLVDGDTLPKLAERYLGRADLDWAIFEANRDVLSDPQLLPLRVEITIPATSELDSIRQGTHSVSPTALQPLQPLGGSAHLRMTPL